MLEQLVRIGAELGARFRDPDTLLDAAIREAQAANPWFTETNIRTALEGLAAEFLDSEKLHEWLSHYQGLPVAAPKRVGMILAGNIPLVGFWDLLCGMLSGHTCLVKPSSKDRALTLYCLHFLHERAPNLPLRAVETLPDIDALVATGSDNSTRYFVSEFPGIPAVIRHNRSSVAVLTNHESEAQLDALARDVFTHFGLGCRNVSRLFVPTNYDFEPFLKQFAFHNPHFEKYTHNYQYNRAQAQLLNEPFLDGGFFTLRETEAPAKALSEIVFTRYANPAFVTDWLRVHDDQIQCVVGFDHPRGVPFGKTQTPQLTDYPDGIDLLQFLAKLNDP